MSFDGIDPTTFPVVDEQSALVLAAARGREISLEQTRMIDARLEAEATMNAAEDPLEYGAARVRFDDYSDRIKDLAEERKKAEAAYVALRNRPKP